MCIVNFHYKNHPNYRLIVVANRDEFYGRPTAPAHFWTDKPIILAGRDLEQKGTWLGITKTGRFTALTNIRDFTDKRSYHTSRGAIVTNFLLGSMSPIDYLQKLSETSNDYDGFNIIVSDQSGLFYLNNRENEVIEVERGTHSVSNHFLNTPWPKVIRGKANLRNYVTTNSEMNNDDLFAIAMDEEIAEDNKLPSTGVSLELERQLSPLFIQTDNYGTRSTTVLTIDNYNHVNFTERTYVKGKFSSEETFSFDF